MSYCRWSSDGFQCDLYCYEDVSGGFTTHVAGRRNKDRCPEIDYTSEATIEATFPAYNAWLKKKDREYINLDLPHAGESFNDPDLQSFRERIVYLKSLGYNCPDYVIESIDEEIAGETK